MASRILRPIRIEGNIAYVPLTKGYEAIIDAVDAHIVAPFNWCASVDHNTVYAVRGDYRGGVQRFVILHRVLLGSPSGVHVDHIDGNGLNNCRQNLRLATPSQNSCNKRLPVTNTSGFKGVCWVNRSAKWQASIKMNGKQIYLGLHETPEAAHAAYIEASGRVHGEFGRMI